MAIFKRTESISISEEQYHDMYQFYQKLGFNEKQCKKLCSSCFGAKIKIDKNERYHHDWCFYRHADSPPMPLMKGAVRSFSKAMPVMTSTTPVGMVMEEDCCAAMPCMPAPMTTEEPEFNTSETNHVPEIEEATPLDRPQMIFSANVNTASWSYIRSKINLGQKIDKDFVRIEEIINSYDYKLKKPKDDNLFSINIEHGTCAWNQDSELLLIGLKGKKASQKIKQNLAFLVDVSGSMTDRWVLVQMSMMAVISKLGKGDFMSIIAYSDDTVTVAKKMDCSDMNQNIKAVLSIDGIGGCTNGSEGLENAYSYLKDHYHPEANNRVFIFTDGDFNFGVTSEGGLSEYIYQKRETGIYLSVIGYGMQNFKDNKMEALARNGNGNYTFIANPADILDHLWEKLISNLVTIAKDVKISVELNPYFVKEYRLIGYDARVLTQKEFHDTEKAVDGIGSEHNVVALIEFKKGKAVKKYTSRYISENANENQNEFAFIEIHYKTPDNLNKIMTQAITMDDLNQAKSKNMPVAELLAGFGLYLKNSEYKANLDLSLLKEMLQKLDKDEKIDTEEKYSHFDTIRKYLQNQ